MKVMLIFDEAYGGRAERVLGNAFWLIDSPANRPVAEQAWKAASTDPNSALFKGHPPATVQDVLGKVQDIDLHHPEWSEIVVVGAEPTAELTSELEADSLVITHGPEGFLIRRGVRSPPLS
jgi:hypothetical protein